MNVLKTQAVDLGDDCVYVLELLEYPDGRTLIFSRIVHSDLGQYSEALSERRIYPAALREDAFARFEYLARAMSPEATA